MSSVREKIADQYTNLCQPDSEKSCFFCCPPLRSFSYDPLQNSTVHDRILWQNRERFLRGKKNLSQDPEVRPINGWDCWGLGYLDEKKKKVGCLLHPAQNNGTDFRYLVGYERKCAREVCLEAMTFNALSARAKKFYLTITIGMDSFHYSSRKWNPMFPMLLWGKTICENIAEAEDFRPLNRNEFVSTYDTFINLFSYKTDGYLLERIVEQVGIVHCTTSDFVKRYREWKETVLQKYRGRYLLREAMKEDSGSRPVHLFRIPISSSRFLKFALDIWNASVEDVCLLKKEIDNELERFTSAF